MPKVVDETKTARENIPLIGGIVNAKELKDEDVTTMIHTIIFISVAGVFYLMGKSISAMVGLVV